MDDHDEIYQENLFKTMIQKWGVNEVIVNDDNKDIDNDYQEELELGRIEKTRVYKK